MHEDGVTLASQLASRSATGVIGGSELDSPWVSVGRQLDQLLSTDGTHATMAVHAEYAGQAAAYACRAQQPSRRVRAIAHRPSQSTDQHAVQAMTSVLVHNRAFGNSS
jgi:hypothetical protein